MKKQNIKFIIAFIGFVLFAVGIACFIAFLIRNAILVQSKLGFVKTDVFIYDKTQIILLFSGIVGFVIGGATSYVAIIE